MVSCGIPAGFIQRALKVGLSALVIACMDSIALERCSQVSTWWGASCGCWDSNRKKIMFCFTGEILRSQETSKW